LEIANETESPRKEAQKKMEQDLKVFSYEKEIAILISSSD